MAFAGPATDLQQVEGFLAQQLDTVDVPTPQELETLNNMVVMLYEGQPLQKEVADKVLKQYKEHPKAWTRCHSILESPAVDQRTKFFALNVLEGEINTRWVGLPEEQRNGMKEFIVNKAIQLSQSFESLQEQALILRKLDGCLVAILKMEWPDNWPDFISTICAASMTNESLCQNNMVILKLMSEEIFDVKHKMTQAKSKRLKDRMSQEFEAVFKLCEFVLSKSAEISLIMVTLDTLLNFLSWIPIEYIFQTQLISDLVMKFLTVPQFQNATMKCLTEIATIKEPAMNAKQGEMFLHTLQQVSQIIPLQQVNLAQAYVGGAETEKNFVQNLGIFLATFLKEHGSLLETAETQSLLLEALRYLVEVSKVDSDEVFKICLEYWNSLAASLFMEKPVRGGSSVLMVGPQPSERRAVYAPVLVEVRVIMVYKMAKPEQVLVVVDRDTNEVVREQLKDVDTIEQYKQMQETLVYLTHLDYQNTQQIMESKLRAQVDGTEYSWGSLNTLCWAIGSISGAMDEEPEKRFLVTVIKDLLGLCEERVGKDNKAIIASNIMYIVGQYPRFLRQHWKFLKTVVKKLFEFMHEAHEGVQDMACDTFIKIAQKCKKHFVMMQVNEQKPFINEILEDMPAIICDLEAHQIHTFFEAIGHMIYAQADQGIRRALIENLMQQPNAQWREIMAMAQQNPLVLQEQQCIDQLCNILKTNVRACESIGHDYIHQLGNIYMDMLLIYKTMSDNITLAIRQQGEGITQAQIVKSMRVVKREVLKLIGQWVSMSDDAEAVMTNIIPHLLEAVLVNYRDSIPQARDPEVLNTMTKVVTAMREHIVGQVMPIFQTVFDSTLQMINRDYESAPEFRLPFYNLLFAITKHCFNAFSQFQPDHFQLMLNAIVWGFQHPIRNVTETALKITQELLTTVAATGGSFAQDFFQRFYIMLLQNVFQVVTDSTHYCHVNYHAQILSLLFKLVEQGMITAPLNPEDPSMANPIFVHQFVMNALKVAFPHLQPAQIEAITQGFFSYNSDLAKLKQHLRDFLVESKELAGEDTSSLYLEERRQAMTGAEEQKSAQLSMVPGMVAHAQREMDMV